MASRDHTAGALAAGWIEAWQRSDIDWLRAHLAPEFVHESPFGRLEGRDHYLATVEPIARQNVLELTIHDVMAEGDRAAVRFTNRTAAGPVESCDWVRVDGGTILEVRSFYDTAAMRGSLTDDEQARLEGQG